MRYYENNIFYLPVHQIENTKKKIDEASIENNFLLSGGRTNLLEILIITNSGTYIYTYIFDFEWS